MEFRLKAHKIQIIPEYKNPGKEFMVNVTSNLLVANIMNIIDNSIYWLDRMNGNQHENLFFDIIEDFIKHLNMTCYTGITGCEFHYSMYPIGSFYLKHLDQFQDNSNRQYSLISYLNTDWQESDGGHLKIHQLDHDQMISPNQGKTVFFKSNELEHEVMVTNKMRMSVTGWLKRG